MYNPLEFAIPFIKVSESGYNRLADEAQACLGDALCSAQTSDGLFMGRNNKGSLYYTFFGLVLATVTKANINERACKNALESIDFSRLDLVHSAIWLRAKRLLDPRFSKLTSEHLKHLSGLPSGDFPQSDPSSPYSRFLLATLLSDFSVTTDLVDSSVASSQSTLSEYRLKSGLYSNLKDHNQYGTNATASAMFLISEEERQITGPALSNLQQDDGSFKAAKGAPVSDLLSTGTVFFALNRFGCPPEVSPKPFIRKCFRDNGLFGATADDPVSDLEYSVYALLALGGAL